MTLLRLGLGVPYDPVHPEANAQTIQAQCPASGVVLPASNGTIEAFDDRILDDPAQRRAFRFVILAGLGLTFRPQALDVLRTAEGLYRLLGATPLDPAGDGAILWNCGCTLDAQIDIDADITFEDTDDFVWELAGEPGDGLPAVTFEDSDTVAWELVA